MKITKFAVDRPVTTTMLFLALVLFGLLTYSKLAVSLMPEIKLPAMVVSTFHYGATPEEIESEITKKIEDEVSTISDLKLLQSYSMPGMSLVILQFNMSKDADKALDELKSKLDIVTPAIPKEAERPIVQLYSFSDAPVMQLVVSGDVSSNELYYQAKNVIKEKLSRIEGVSKINIQGGEQREIRVVSDQLKMQDVQMNLTDISSYLQSANTKLSGGDFTIEHRQFSVETGKEFKSVREIGEVYIPLPGGSRKLSDFATVVDTVKDVKYKSIFFDGKNDKGYDNVISLSIMKASLANEVKVARNVKEALPEIQEALPDGIAVFNPFDTSEYIESSVDDALMNVILGILFTGIILFFFLNDIRTTLIVSISVPVSLIATFVAIRMFNGSLNMMTLMSFSVAIGALISNSIVVIENIVRLKKEGLEIKEAAVKGTEEVMMAVIASTGTNLVVFLPIATMTSITGAFFKEYALTISAATVISLVVSFMLTPMLASVLLKKDLKPSALSRMMGRFFSWLENQYESSLKALISHKRNPLILFAVMLVFFLTSSGLLSRIGFEFEPQNDDGSVYVELEMPPGTAIDRSLELLTLVEKEISIHPEVNSVLSVLGEKNSFTTGTNFANIAIKLNPKEERDFSNEEFAKQLGEALNQIPEVIPVVSTVSSEDGAALQFTLQSSSQDDLIAANEMVVKKLKTVEGLLNFESTYRKGNQVIHLEPKQRLLSELQMSPLEVAALVRSAVNGVKATVLKENNKEYDIMLSFAGNQINSVEKIKQIPLFTPTGMFTVGQLVDVGYRMSQAQILHKDKERTIEFSASPAPGVVQGDARDQIDEAIATIDLPKGVDFEWSGNIKEMNEAMSDLIITFIIALVLMYMLLASLLENFWHPVIIFTTVPMAMIGVFVIMYMGGQTMNIMSIMAIVTLLGLVVNDDILIHDYTEQLMHKAKMKLKEATLLAGKRKMKTVIMTTVAIIAGMLPNAIGLGDAGSEYRTPMAIVTIGGMITSTVLTLYLIPSLFYVIRNRNSEE